VQDANRGADAVSTAIPGDGVAGNPMRMWFYSRLTRHDLWKKAAPGSRSRV